MRSFRGLRYFLAPPWLTGRGDGEKVAFTLEWLLDSFLEKLRQGLNARFPSRAGASAANLIAGDRGLLRGRSETLAELAVRLKAWRTPRTHKVRGNAYEALLQIWHYWGGIKASTVDAHGLRHTIELADDPTDVNSLADPDTYAPWIDGGNTTWDDVDADVHWSRFWVFLEPHAALDIEPTADFGDAALWGGALNTPGYTLGQTSVTPDDVFAMRALFSELAWHPLHTIPEWVVLVFDGDPLPEPDGTWGTWSRNDGGTQVATRDPAYRYWALDASSNRYDGVADFPEASDDVELTGTYTGDPDDAASWGAIALPDGTLYEGDPTRFNTNVQLVDDGTVT